MRIRQLAIVVVGDAYQRVLNQLEHVVRIQWRRTRDDFARTDVTAHRRRQTCQT